MTLSPITDQSTLAEIRRRLAGALKDAYRFDSAWIRARGFVVVLVARDFYSPLETPSIVERIKTVAANQLILHSPLESGPSEVTDMDAAFRSLGISVEHAQGKTYKVDVSLQDIRLMLANETMAGYLITDDAVSFAILPTLEQFYLVAGRRAAVEAIMGLSIAAAGRVLADALDEASELPSELKNYLRELKDYYGGKN